jgi:hypothetical protein
MYKSVKSKAEEQFAATQKKNKQALTEKEKARRERAEHVVSLRALRLAKEAADKEAAEEANSKAPSPAERDLSELEPQGTIEKDVEENLLEIPPDLRRQTS